VLTGTAKEADGVVVTAKESGMVAAMETGTAIVGMVAAGVAAGVAASS
jgi:hypothetical protein